MNARLPIPEPLAFNLPVDQTPGQPAAQLPGAATTLNRPQPDAAMDLQRIPAPAAKSPCCGCCGG
jgi:hypothetical protein